MKPPTKWPAKFLIFWGRYPRKIAKGNALRAWHKNDCEEIGDEIIEALERYQFSDEMKFVKHPASWINSWCWMDEFETKAPTEDDPEFYL